MGGATIGYALARAGWRVLFCEKGRSTLHGMDALRGDYAESHFTGNRALQLESHDVLRSAGRQAEEICDVSGPRPRCFVPLIGSGTRRIQRAVRDGSRAFLPCRLRAKSSLPGGDRFNSSDYWPISYGDLAPFYEAAEQLYGIRRIERSPEGQHGMSPDRPRARVFVRDARSRRFSGASGTASVPSPDGLRIRPELPRLPRLSVRVLVQAGQRYGVPVACAQRARRHFGG